MPCARDPSRHVPFQWERKAVLPAALADELVEEDLDPLREREDYKKLFAELEAKQKESGVRIQRSD